MYIYEIKSFHQNEKLERVLSFYADNGNAQIDLLKPAKTLYVKVAEE